MNYSEAVISGLLLGIFIAMSVGPTLFAIIQYSMHHTYKAGVVFILGVSLSDIIYVTLANIATNFLTFLENHQDTIGYAGAILFMSIGLWGLLKKYKPKKPVRKGEKSQISKGTYLKIFGSGFLMNALNPAVLILWMGAAIKVSDYYMAERVVFFGVCLGIVLGADITKVLLADKIKNWLTLRKIMYLNKIAAFCILLFGCILFAKVFFQINFR